MGATESRIYTVRQVIFMHALPLFLLVCLFSPIIVQAQNQPQSEPQTPAAAGIRPPVPLVAPDAVFPFQAESKGQTGVCLLSLVVDAKGMPLNPRVVRCSDPMFVSNSIDAVLKYRFKPAVRIADGQPVPVQISAEVRFLFVGQSPATEPPTQIRYGFFSPPGTVSAGPDSNGIYSLTRQMEEPKMKEFVSKGFGEAAISFPDGVGCHVLLTINQKGKPVDAKVLDCDKSKLAQPAVDSLMASKYRPAKLRGKAIPVRVTIHLMYDGFGPHKELNAGSTASKP